MTPWLHAEPLGFDQVAEELQEHWEAAQLLQSLPADQTNAGTSSEASTSTGPGSNSSSGEYGAGPTSSDQALAQINPAQSSFQLMQPFSDAGIAQNAEKVVP